MGWNAVKDFLVRVLTSPEMVKAYAVFAGILVWWLIDNYVDKPAARRIALEIAVAIEKETKEGTPVDKFLDEFIKRFKVEKERDPSAGELKTALDIKNKRISLNYNKKF